MRSDSEVPAAARHTGADRPPRLDVEKRIHCLGVVFPRNLQQCFKLGVAPRTIGSSRNADIVLNGEGVAPVHCRISMDDGQAHIEDLGTPFGTWVDGVRMDSGRLLAGQTLRIGHYRFMLGERPEENQDVTDKDPQSPGTDNLTGIANRAWVLRRAEQILEARADSPRPITLAMLTLDQLDEMHHRHGFRAGDSLLRGVAKLLESNLREKEIIGLMGPEKLLLILPEVDKDDARVRLGHMCQRVREQSFVHGPQSLSATLSVGYTTREGYRIRSLDQFLTQADRALYRARRWGGDQVITLS